MGLDPTLLADAYETLRQGVEIGSDAVAKQSSKGTNGRQEKKNYFNKELIYEDESAFIYQRGDTKSKIYYLRIFDHSSKKPYVKSLGTTDHAKALVKARTIYQEIKGKIIRGERLRTITSPELIDMYLRSLHISDVPHTGVTPETLKLKRYYLNTWLEYIASFNCSSTPIDQLPMDKLIKFGYWFRDLPRKDGRVRKTRSFEQINNAISEVKLAYYKVAVKNRYISQDLVPKIDRLKQPKNSAPKRDILELHQYNQFWRFLEYKYQREKNLTELEKHRRILFTKFVGVMVNTGMRPKEFLTLRWKDISAHRSTDPNLRKKIAVISIRAENSKTGRARNIVAPVRNRLEVIKQSYKDLGYEPKPNDFVLWNVEQDDRRAYTRQTFFCRLKETLKLSGVQSELDDYDNSISLYSFRHQYICWRLRYGQVPIHLIAKNCGTSIQKIDETYGHIEVEKQVDILTQNQGIMRSADIDLTTEILD